MRNIYILLITIRLYTTGDVKNGKEQQDWREKSQERIEL
jgi:hypothetical protein